MLFIAYNPCGKNAKIAAKNLNISLATLYKAKKEGKVLNEKDSIEIGVINGTLRPAIKIKHM